jgi:tRNA 2-thiocytidine biosynthesis protein TtcA
MLREWEKKYPGRIDSIFGALGNVVPSHLMDRNLFDFGAVKASGVPTADGDIAFDADPALERSAAAEAETRFAIDAIAIRPSAAD